jgi:hypothetical protein
MPGRNARRPFVPERPVPVQAPPPPPDYVVATLLEDQPFTAVYAGGCENPHCRVPRITVGQGVVRSLDGEYFHVVCAITGSLQRREVPLRDLGVTPNSDRARWAS